jgi:hypothetical protein
MTVSDGFPEQQKSHDRKDRLTRPPGIWLVSSVLIIAGGVYLIRFYGSVIQWGFLERILPFSPLYLALSGVFWGILNLISAVLVWIGWKGSRRAIIWFFVLSSIYYWIERLSLQSNPFSSTNWIFVLTLNILFLAWIVWLFNAPRIQAFYDHKMAERMESR